jgi:hypothetical protein
MNHGLYTALLVGPFAMVAVAFDFVAQRFTNCTASKTKRSRPRRQLPAKSRQTLPSRRNNGVTYNRANRPPNAMQISN